MIKAADIKRNDRVTIRKPDGSTLTRPVTDTGEWYVIVKINNTLVRIPETKLISHTRVEDM